MTNLRSPSEAPLRASTRFAFRSVPALVLFVAVAGATLAADLLSKHVVFDRLLADANCQRQSLRYLAERPGTPPRLLLGLYHHDLLSGVRWTLSTNPGVVFGVEAIPRWAVNVATLVAVILVTVMFACSDRRAWATHLALSLILAGALGNLYDRLFCAVALPGTNLVIHQEVRDFIDMSQLRLGSLHYPWIFNVADALLVIGVAILMLHLILHPNPRPAKAGEEKTKTEMANRE
jgi:lipoprotein signal peptidase